MGSLDLKKVPLSLPDELGGMIAKRLWNKFKNERALALYSPYVVCLASATLDTHTFLHCASQDVFFLQAFAQAYEFAEEYADDDDDKQAIIKLRKRVLSRLRKQDKHIQEWGFELPEETNCSDATVKYTEFLKETAAGEKFAVNIVTPFEKTKLAAYTLSAISPCMRLYSFISKEIQSLLQPEENHIYKKWLNSLSSEKFEASASRIEDLLDKLSICLTGEELDVVERLYHRAMELEIEFIWSQTIVQQTLVPFSRLDSAKDNLNVFCDFDLTCTAIDSSALLAELAIVAATDGSGDDIRTTWSNLYSEYVDEYQHCIKSVTSDTSFEKGLDYDGLYEALQQISILEKKANSRMIDSNVSKGLNLSDIRRAGEHIAFQDGCKEFLQDIESKNCPIAVHVLSSCWCGDLMKAAFSSGMSDYVVFIWFVAFKAVENVFVKYAFKAVERIGLSLILKIVICTTDEMNKLNIHSNDLVYEESISTGDMVRKIECSLDKLQAFHEINTCDTEKNPLTVYIGGSVGDLLCLLEADIGIVIGTSTSLTTLANHFGISFVPLFAGLVSKQRELTEKGSLKREGKSSVLYTVENWNEMYAFILGQ